MFIVLKWCSLSILCLFQCALEVRKLFYCCRKSFRRSFLSRFAHQISFPRLALNCLFSLYFLIIIISTLTYYTIFAIKDDPLFHFYSSLMLLLLFVPQPFTFFKESRKQHCSHPPCEIAFLSSPLSQRASSNKHLPNKRTKTPLIAICAFHSSSSPHTSASPSSPC